MSSAVHDVQGYHCYLKLPVLAINVLNPPIEQLFSVYVVQVFDVRLSVYILCKNELNIDLPLKTGCLRYVIC